MTQNDDNTIKRCSCGHDKTSQFVIAHEQFSILGNILHLIGISATPIKIEYQCIKCQEYFDQKKNQNNR